MGNKNYVPGWRARTKQRLSDAFDNKCAICGGTFPPCVFDFHHLDPDTLVFRLSEIRKHAISWKRIVKEVRKCIMVCSNCHRQIHYNNKKIPDVVTRFNEEYAEQKKSDIPKKIKPKQRRFKNAKYNLEPCPQCGGKVKFGLTYCSKLCSELDRRKVERPSQEKLMQLIKEKGYRGTGKMFGVSDNAIRKWIK